MIPDQGSLKETAPARLMLALYEQNQTGILYFRQNEILKVFYLNSGKISWAISSDEEDRIEHVLLARKLISPELLAPYQSNNKITQSFGKVLVENGVLSLEGLINATREQVRHIAASVMRWGNGSYQLVQEAPPTRLVSLDLEIPGLVSGYILEQMDVNIAWEELGALSGELQQNLEPGRKNLYPLDVEQQEVFSRFSKPQRLESVLLEFPAERKYRILKILYYLLLTGLLSKKEAEKMPSLDFKELDSLFGQSPPDSSGDVDIEMPAMINEAEIKDIPLAELPEMPAMKDEEENAREHLELPDLMPPGIPDDKEEAKEIPVESETEKTRPNPHPFLKPEKQKPHWRSVTFLSILLAAALIGSFLWLTRTGAKPEEAAPPAAARNVRQRPAPRKPVPIPGEEKTAPQSGGESVAGAKTSLLPADSGPPRGRRGVADGSPPAGTPATEKTKPAEAEKELAVAPAPGGEAQARQRFAAGNFQTAGEIWRQEIKAARFKFSILLELDCLKESVHSAYRQLEDKNDFFLLNKTSRDGRSCYLVLWGRYRTADEAALGMKQVPAYFMKQSNPASVIELEPYL
jgi:septal ring-binding cell division protein DamX